MGPKKSSKSDIGQRRHDVLRLIQGTFRKIAIEYSDEEILDFYTTAIVFGPELIGREKLPPYLDLISAEIHRRAQNRATRVAWWSVGISALSLGIAAMGFVRSGKERTVAPSAEKSLPSSSALSPPRTATPLPGPSK